jgi:hypothetical protein
MFRASAQRDLGERWTILEALDDPNLFAPHFRRDSWQPWRSALVDL